MKFKESSESNFNNLKKEIEGLNWKMDELKQLLVKVSNKFIYLYFIIFEYLTFLFFLIIIFCLIYATSG